VLFDSNFVDGDNGYMTFGISGDSAQSTMVGSDVIVVYLNNGVPMIEDYSINGYSLVSIYWRSAGAGCP
jgi:hypothetical protein